jgi:hypothetical protein
VQRDSKFSFYAEAQGRTAPDDIDSSHDVDGVRLGLLQEAG